MSFQEEKYLTPRRKKRIALETGLQIERIQVWFQNRRAREKRRTEEELALEYLSRKNGNINQTVYNHQSNCHIANYMDEPLAFTKDKLLTMDPMSSEFQFPSKIRKYQNTEHKKLEPEAKRPLSVVKENDDMALQIYQLCNQILKGKNRLLILHAIVSNGAVALRTYVARSDLS